MYPANEYVISKQELNKDIDTIINHLKDKIINHKVATYIGLFDHYQHTKQLNWEILPEIKNVKILIFCFWKSITNYEVLTGRPRNLVIIETNDKFIFRWLKAPQEEANQEITNWIKSLK